MNKTIAVASDHKMDNTTQNTRVTTTRIIKRAQVGATSNYVM